VLTRLYWEGVEEPRTKVWLRKKEQAASEREHSNGRMEGVKMIVGGGKLYLSSGNEGSARHQEKTK